MKKKYVAAIGATVAVAVGWIAVCGYLWSWGPFNKLHDIKTGKLPGNNPKYALEKQKEIKDSPMNGKNIIFLGSSVTYGASSKGISFADYITKRNGCSMIKEAVSGTTLVTMGKDSYISRMKKIDKQVDADLFVCQLSTNDATQKKPLGKVGEETTLEEFDTQTIAGAMEYIICYAQKTWDCPVVFYTNPRYDSGEYAAMVELLQELEEKWDISVIDLWNDEEFNAISDVQRNLYMADKIHPTQAGYLEWWTPRMEQDLYEISGEGR